MQTEDHYSNIILSDIVGIILSGGEQADEAMYYLLHQTFYLQLKKRYEVVHHQLLDDFEDILDDFFFYLRNGSPITYPSLHRIRNRQAFPSWLLRTFRNYLCVRATMEGSAICAKLESDSIPDTHADSSSILTDEQKLSAAANLIAYALQEMPSRDSFLLLRALLTMLNKRQALPNEDISKALGMTDVSYRVTVHRVKNRLAQYRNHLLRCKSLDLDVPHQQMAQRINDDFLHLYPTLLSYYNQTIAALAPDHADAINRLRQNYLAATGNLMHEPEIPYFPKPSKTALWNMVGRVIDE